MIEIWQEPHPIVSHELNKTYHEIRLTPDRVFRDWFEKVRVFLDKCWENDGIPPQNGMPLDRIERELQKLSVCPSYGLVWDEGTNEQNVIAGPRGYGHCLRRIFPNMDCVGDGNKDGRSIHDFLTTAGKTTEVANALSRGWHNHFERNVKGDSYLMYSPQLQTTNPIALGAETGVEWVKLRHASPNADIGFWCEATNKRGKNEDLFLSADELEALRDGGLIDQEQIVNVLGSEASRYRLRTYERSKRIFPAYFRLMRKTLVVSASHFAPAVAKSLIQLYT